MSKRAAQKAFAKAGVKPSDVQVVELHGKWVLCTREYFEKQYSVKMRKYVLGREGSVLETFDLLITWWE